MTISEMFRSSKIGNNLIGYSRNVCIDENQRMGGKKRRSLCNKVYVFVNPVTSVWKCCLFIYF